MRKLPILIAAALALPAAAQSQEVTRGTQRLELTARAPVACVISPATVSSAANASYSNTGASSGQVSITELVDGSTAAPRASSIELNLPVVCNASHRVQLRSTNGGLQRAGASGRSGAFREFLTYQVGLDWAGQSVQLDTASRSANINSGQPGKGEMIIRIVTPAGGSPLVAGQYSDSIVVEVQPAN